jgi:hypothetical protein
MLQPARIDLGQSWCKLLTGDNCTGGVTGSAKPGRDLLARLQGRRMVRSKNSIAIGENLRDALDRIHGKLRTH